MYKEKIYFQEFCLNKKQKKNYLEKKMLPQSRKPGGFQETQAQRDVSFPKVSPQVESQKSSYLLEMNELNLKCTETTVNNYRS